jgi:hypothetical protein
VHLPPYVMIMPSPVRFRDMMGLRWGVMDLLSSSPLQTLKSI